MVEDAKTADLEPALTGYGRGSDGTGGGNVFLGENHRNRTFGGLKSTIGVVTQARERCWH